MDPAGTVESWRVSIRSIKLIGIRMAKYYQAYEERYKTIHEMGIAWELNEPTPEIAQWIKYVSLNHSEPILDVGCGEGRDAYYLTQEGYRIIGIDISQEAINWCKNRMPG